MHAVQPHEERTQNRQVADFPTLRGLRLDDDDLRELARQGFLAAEQRGQRRYFKLRFRRDGRQVVRYVGGADQAHAVRQELAVLQRERRRRRRLAALTRTAAQALSAAKQALAPLLEARGLHFHGGAIRGRRPTPK